MTLASDIRTIYGANPEVPIFPIIGEPGTQTGAGGLPTTLTPSSTPFDPSNPFATPLTYGTGGGDAGAGAGAPSGLGVPSIPGVVTQAAGGQSAGTGGGTVDFTFAPSSPGASPGASTSASGDYGGGGDAPAPGTSPSYFGNPGAIGDPSIPPMPTPTDPTGAGAGPATAGGAAASAAINPLQQIYEAGTSWLQRFGVLLLGVALVIVAAWALSRGELQRQLA